MKIDSTQTPPGYWFGVIEDRLHERMRAALADLGLRRSGWRILHLLADGPATAEQLAERLPHGPAERRDATGRPHREHGFGPGRGYGFRPGWRGQEPRDERAEQHAHHGGPHPGGPGDPGHEPGHAEHDSEHASEHAFERGYAHGFDRGFGAGARAGGHPFGAPFGGWHGQAYGHGYGVPFGHRHPFDGHRHPAGRDHRRGHRIHRVLADFVERGWVWFDGDRATLTDEGRAAHEQAFERVRAVRADLAEGIPEADYATTLATLEAMARNLGWRPSTRPEAPEAEEGGQQDGQEGGQEGEPSMDA